MRATLRPLALDYSTDSLLCQPKFHSEYRFSAGKLALNEVKKRSDTRGVKLGFGAPIVLRAGASDIQTR